MRIRWEERDRRSYPAGNINFSEHFCFRILLIESYLVYYKFERIHKGGCQPLPTYLALPPPALPPAASAGPVGTFLSGGVAGTCLWSFMFPTDVIKSRIQVTGSRQPMWAVALHIYRAEGG